FSSSAEGTTVRFSAASDMTMSLHYMDTYVIPFDSVFGRGLRACRWPPAGGVDVSCAFSHRAYGFPAWDAWTGSLFSVMRNPRPGYASDFTKSASGLQKDNAQALPNCLLRWFFMRQLCRK